MGGQTIPSCIPGCIGLILISWWRPGRPPLPWCANQHAPPTIKRRKREKPTMIKNREIRRKNLPSSSFFVFASNKVPARIVSNAINSRCIVSNLKPDYSFNGFRHPRSPEIIFNKEFMMQHEYKKILTYFHNLSFTSTRSVSQTQLSLNHPIVSLHPQQLHSTSYRGQCTCWQFPVAFQL